MAVRELAEKTGTDIGTGSCACAYALDIDMVYASISVLCRLHPESTTNSQIEAREIWCVFVCLFINFIFSVLIHSVRVHC